MDLLFLVRRLAEQAVPEPGTGRLRLPTERDLGASLQVSRGSLREQLSMLEMLGFLDRTQGRGSYLQVPDAGFLRLYFDLSRQLDQLTPEQFDAAREMLEISVAEAAAECATDDDVAELRGLVDEDGLTVLLVEQNARSALSIADVGIVLNLGRVVAREAAGDLAADDALRHAYLGF